MMRKIKYLYYIMVNLLRLPMKCILSGFHLHFKPIQLIAPSSNIEINNKGILYLNGMVHTEKNAFISVSNGVLRCEGFFLNRNSLVVCRDSITIHRGVTIGPNTVIYDHDHDVQNRGKLKTAPIEIGENAWIGANATILKGVKIGKNSIVAAGSVVNKSVPDGYIVGGVPAKCIKKINHDV